MPWLSFGQSISIHAPSRERRMVLYKLVRESRFQSTLPRGSDKLHAFCCERPWISIHAPSRERPRTAYKAMYNTEFQSTLPRGSDRLCRKRLQRRSYFNPRSLAGATVPKIASLRRIGISIHAPSRERRNALNAISVQVFNFNPRSLAGATCLSGGIVLRYTFQSTLPRGSDSQMILCTADASSFQSTLPRGSDPGSSLDS